MHAFKAFWGHFQHSDANRLFLILLRPCCCFSTILAVLILLYETFVLLTEAMQSDAALTAPNPPDFAYTFVRGGAGGGFYVIDTDHMT